MKNNLFTHFRLLFVLLLLSLGTKRYNYGPSRVEKEKAMLICTRSGITAGNVSYFCNDSTRESVLFFFFFNLNIIFKRAANFSQFYY